MATEFKVRRGTTAEHAAFTGAEGEITLDTTKDTLVVHDAYQAGGFPMLREDLNNLANNAAPVNKLAYGSPNQVLVTNATGDGVEWGYANNAGTLTTGTLSTSRMATGTVVQTYRRNFNSQHNYGGSPVNISIYDFTFSNLTVGNKVVVWMSLFGEAQHDMSMYVNRNGTRLLEGSGGDKQGIFTPKYDQNEDSTPNFGTVIFIDDVVSTSQTYNFYKEGNGSDWWVNRCYSSANETGVTTIVAQEIKG